MDSEQITKCMKALCDPKRMEIFRMLANGKLCACKILEKFDMTQPTLSYHMKLLSDAKLIVVEKDWKWSYYSIDKNTFDSMIKYFQDFNF